MSILESVTKLRIDLREAKRSFVRSGIFTFRCESIPWFDELDSVTTDVLHGESVDMSTKLYRESELHSRRRLLLTHLPVSSVNVMFVVVSYRYESMWRVRVVLP
jgi:hypothetical protein